MTVERYSDRHLETVLEKCRTIAMVGISNKLVRPSYFVGNYLQMQGYGVIPVNPVLAGESLFGGIGVGELSEIPESVGDVHMVDIFRRSDAALPIVEQAIAHLADRGLKAIWMQIGVVNHAAASLARDHGLDVIMNRCPKMEYQRLSGELSRGGINSGIISSRRPRLTGRQRQE